MASWLEKSRSPEYSPAKLSQMLAEVEAVIGISELDEAMAGETIIAGGYLNTHLIKAKSIIAEQLDVNSLSAISADIGEVTSGIITGATIRTSSSGDRVELSDMTLKGFYGGTKRVELTNYDLNFYAENGTYAGGLWAAIADPTGETLMYLNTDKQIQIIADKGPVPEHSQYAGLTVFSGDPMVPQWDRPKAAIESGYAGIISEMGVQVNINNKPTGWYESNQAPAEAHFSFNSRLTAYELYSATTVSADSFIDRTPFYEGDALADIRKINGNKKELDHKTLPEFARSKIKNEALGKAALTTNDGTLGESEGRDIGAMVSMLTVGMQQLAEIVEGQQKQIDEITGGIKQYENYKTI